MAQTSTRQEQYNAGFAAATEAISILRPTMSAEAFRVVVTQNIIRVHVTDVTDYSQGQSDAWADEQRKR